MAAKIKIPRELASILSDNSSGSSILLSRLNSYFIKHSNDFPFLLPLIPYIKNELKSFAGITDYLSKIEKLVSKNQFAAFLKEFGKTETDKYDKLFIKIYPYIKQSNKIVTFSNSRTVLEILYRLKKKNKKLRVVVSESRPVNEGRITAEKLAEKKIKVDFITEAMLPSFIERCDCALLGADMILKNGSVVNKTGSRLLAVLCKEYGKRLYVIADKTKQTSKTKYKPERKPADEVWGAESGKWN